MAKTVAPTASTAAGAGLGALIGDSKESVGKGSVWGTLAAPLVGALAEWMMGDSEEASIVKGRQAYASEREFIQANCRQLSARRDSLIRAKHKLKEMLAFCKHKSEKVSAKDIAETKENINRLVSLADRDIAVAKTADTDAQLEAAIASLTQQRNDLLKLAEKLDS